MQNAFDNLSLKELSDLIHRSKVQTNRIFKDAFDTTPYEFLLECKMKHAKNMLLSSNLSVKEISELLNFSDEHYFSNLFKTKIGVSPKNYRNQNILNRKILHASELLLSSSMSIREIAHSLQFSTESFCVEEFAKQMGLTPQSFRKKNLTK